MATNLIGVTAVADQVHVVLLAPGTTIDSFTLLDDTTLHIQSGERAAAYNVLHGQFADYVRQHDVACVCFKGSAVSKATTLAHLHAAELRGVMLAAAASAGVEVRTMNKASASRTFGSRKVDEYLKDNTYWGNIGLAALKKGKREAAFAVLACSS